MSDGEFTITMTLDMRDLILAHTGGIHNNAKKRRIIRGYSKKWMKNYLAHKDDPKLSDYITSAPKSDKPLTVKAFTEILDSLGL